MPSQQPGRRPSVSFAAGHRVHALSPRPSPEPGLEEQMPLPANSAWQAGVYGIPMLNSAAPQFFMPGPPVQTTLPSFSIPIPPTPMLPIVELPPSASLALGGPAPALPLPAGTTNSSVPTLGTDELELPLPHRGDPSLGLPIVWRLRQQWDVRDSGLPIGLPANEPIQALCGVPEVVLRFVPHPLFSEFGYTIAVEPNAEDKLVVTVGDLARAVQMALRVPLEGRVSDEQRSVLRDAQRYRRPGRAPVDCHVDMWGSGRMFLRHLVSLSDAEGGLSREFVVCFQLIV